MELDIQSPDQPTEHRRSQNRIAQRRFRGKSNAATPPPPLIYTCRFDSDHVADIAERRHQRRTGTSIDDVSSSSLAAPARNPPPLSQQLSVTDDPMPDLSLAAMSSAPTLSSSAIQHSNTSFDSSPTLDDVNLWDLDAIDNFLYRPSTSVPGVETSSFLSQLGPSLDYASSNTVQTSPSSSMALDGYLGSSANFDVPQSSAAHHQISNGFVGPGIHAGPVPPSDRSGFSSPLSYDSSGLMPSLATGDGWLSTLHIAAQKGHNRIVRVLMQHQVNCNVKDSDGRTPLMHAVIEDHEAVVVSLLAYGARVGERDCVWRSALHWAVWHRRESILRILLKHHSERERDLDIDTYDENGWTSLHIAVERGFEMGVLMLMQCGANLHSKARKCPLTGKVISPDRS